jgi:hypothetical protein
VVVFANLGNEFRFHSVLIAVDCLKLSVVSFRRQLGNQIHDILGCGVYFVSGDESIECLCLRREKLFALFVAFGGRNVRGRR